MSTMSDEQVAEIANAIRAIAHGSIDGPAGIEALTMAIADTHRKESVANSLLMIAEAINNLANAVEDKK